MNLTYENQLIDVPQLYNMPYFDPFVMSSMDIM